MTIYTYKTRIFLRFTYYYCLFDYINYFRGGTEHPGGPERTRSRNLSSQELRGQAPWSYLHPSLPPQQIPPTIPTPDYINKPQQRSPYQQSRVTPAKRKYSIKYKIT